MPTRKQIEKTYELPVMTRAAAVKPSTLDEAGRTVTVVLSTGARRVMRTWDGDIEEELPITAEAIDLERLNSVAPLFDNHRHNDSVLNTLGTIVPGSARIEGGELVAEIRFATTDRGMEALKLVADGTIRSVSVGYDAQYSMVRARDRQDGGSMDLWTAIRWEPYEASLTGMPADVGAKIRGEEPRTTRAYPVRHFEEQEPMADRNKAPEPTGEGTEKTPITASPVDPSEGIVRTANLIKATRARLTSTGLDPAKADALVVEHRGDENAINRNILDMMAEESAKTRVSGHVRVSVGMEEADHAGAAIRASVTQLMATSLTGDVGIAVRKKLGDDKNSGMDRRDDLVRGLGSVGMLGLARHYLRAHGHNPDMMSKTQVANAVLGARSVGGMHTSGDFPLILAAGAQTILLARLEAERSQIVEFFRPRNLPDFRTVTLVRRGAGPALLPLAPGGEIQRGTIGESGEDVKMQRRARGFSLDRTMIINDTLSAFTDGVETMIEAVRDSRQEILEAPFVDNPMLRDGSRLFDETLGTDLTSAYGAPSATIIHAMGALMARQAELIDGGIGKKKRRGTRRPGAWVAAFDEAIVIDKLLNSDFLAAKAEDAATPGFRNQRVYDVGALLDETPRPYFAVDPRNSGLVYGMLEGETGPEVRQEEGFWQDGISFAVIDNFYSGVESRGGCIRAHISDPS